MHFSHCNCSPLNNPHVLSQVSLLKFVKITGYTEELSLFYLDLKVCICLSELQISKSESDLTV